MTQVTQNKETEAFLIELFRAFFSDPVRFRTLTLRSGQDAGLHGRGGVGDLADDLAGAGLVGGEDADGESSLPVGGGRFAVGRGFGSGSRIGGGSGFFIGMREVTGDADFGEAGFENFGESFVGAGPDFGGGVFGMKFAGDVFGANIVGTLIVFGRDFGAGVVFIGDIEHGGCGGFGIQRIGEGSVADGFGLREIRGGNPDFQVDMLRSEDEARVEFFFVVRNLCIVESEGQSGVDAAARAFPKHDGVVELRLRRGRG